MFKLNRNISKQFTALAMSGVIAISGLSLSGCKKKNTNPTPTASITDTTKENGIEDTYNASLNKLKETFPNMKDDVAKNATLILLLDVIAPTDENDKVDASNISLFKSRIDSDNMMSDFNALLDELEQKMIDEETVISLSEVLPKEMSEDKTVLTVIENIVRKALSASTKEEANAEFDKIYKLFVDEDVIVEQGTNVDIRDLSFASRAVANAYARTVACYSKDSISEERYSKLDKRTNEQNNKAYIKTTLEILRNSLDEKSLDDAANKMNSLYSSFDEDTNGKIKGSELSKKGLINYLNLDYLDSDKVSVKDKKEVLINYSEENVEDSVLLIEAITKYNESNNEIIVLSNYLVDANENDKTALDFVQFNSLKLLETSNKDNTDEDLFQNPYFKNLYKYFTKQNFIHSVKGEEKNIIWQEISDGVNFVNYSIIIDTLNKLPNTKLMDTYKSLTNEDLMESIQYIQNVVIGECKKVDSLQYVK